jgi:cell wall-associated NlpC family hydrolase
LSKIVLTRRLKHASVQRITAVCAVMLMLIALALPAEARTRRHRRPSALRVALEPFSLVHSAVHAVAAPIAIDSVRLAAEVATAPVRVAYHATRPSSAEEPRDEDANNDVNERIYTPEPLRAHGAVDYNQPMRVAYVVPRAASPVAPQAQPADDGAEPDESQRSTRKSDRDDADDERMESHGSKPIVSGSHAVLRGGIAYAPSQAPQAVKNAIWAANTLRYKPYVWGGGHGSFYDRGYDCSGTVSFALHSAGVIGSPLPSSDLMRFGEGGRGRWFTVYSRNGHTFAVIAGLRLDTTDFMNGGNTGPRWHADLRDTSGYVARHPAGM